MNRAIPAAIITAVGLGALASFRSTSGLAVKPASSAAISPRTRTPAGSRPPARTPSTTAPARDTPTTGTPATAAPQNTAPPATPPATTRQVRTIDGDPIDSQYGTVQLRVTLRGNQITDIVALQMPDSHQRSLEISQAAEPILRQEALQAQSAQIDIVSGATFTSDSYAQSLQSVLDRSNG